jgi:hypothetical protein
MTYPIAAATASAAAALLDLTVSLRLTPPLPFASDACTNARPDSPGRTTCSSAGVGVHSHATNECNSACVRAYARREGEVSGSLGTRVRTALSRKTLLPLQLITTTPAETNLTGEA